jgi:hypothetical protein
MLSLRLGLGIYVRWIVGKVLMRVVVRPTRVPPDSLYICPKRYLRLPRNLSYSCGARYEARVTCEEAGCVGEASVAHRMGRHDVP